MTVFIKFVNDKEKCSRDNVVKVHQYNGVTVFHVREKDGQINKYLINNREIRTLEVCNDDWWEDAK